MAVDGETYLRRLIEDRLRQDSEWRADPTDFLPSLALAEAQAAADALVGVGALGRRQADELYLALRQALLDAGIIREVRASAHSETRLSAVAGSREAAENFRSILQRREPVAEPMRVVPLVREMEGAGDRRLVLMSLELWSAWFRLRYAMSVPEPASPDEPPDAFLHLIWEAVDDVGTRYRQGGGSGGGGLDWTLMETEFRPAIPPEARALTLVARSLEDAEVGSIVIDL